MGRGWWFCLLSVRGGVVCGRWVCGGGGEGRAGGVG